MERKVRKIQSRASQGASEWGFPGAEGVPLKNAPRIKGLPLMVSERRGRAGEGPTAIASEAIGKGLAGGVAGGMARGKPVPAMGSEHLERAGGGKSRDASSP